jgi:hypothetical protein
MVASSLEHWEQGSGVASVFAFLSVIPGGNLLFCSVPDSP